MQKKAENPVVEPAEIDVPTIPKGTTSEETPKLPPLEERYKQSSQEGIRLAKELKAEQEAREKAESELNETKSKLDGLKDFTPFINALEKDPKLVEHITSYWQPKEENLQDLDLTDPKVFQEQVDRRARELIRDELATFKQSSQKESAIERQIQEFLVKHPDKSRKDVENLIKWSKENPMTLDHLYMLKNPDEISKRTAEATQKSMTEQMRKISETPASLATANSAGTPESPVDELFKAMERRINGLNMNELEVER